MSTAARTVSLHRALTRPLLLAGAERMLVILNGTLIAVLVMGVGLTTITLTIAALLATVGFWGLRMAAHHDPQLSAVFARHQRYQTIYLAQASCHS